MNKIKNMLFAGALTLSAFGAVTYTSCTKDECKGVQCNNGGSCAGGNCSCPTGYSGTYCDSLWSAKYTGQYQATTEVCTISGSNSAYSITVAPSGTTATSILITNLYNAGKTTTATLTSATTFTISSQAFGSSGTITGTGTLSGTQLTISYSVTVSGATDACNNVVFAKQ